MSTALLLVAAQASAATLNVCPSGCPYTQLAPALGAAHDGDTIRLGPGTYDGGVTIDVSVKLAGAGAGRTIISGGGPVLTIGEFGASTEPIVSGENPPPVNVHSPFACRSIPGLPSTTTV